MVAWTAPLAILVVEDSATLRFALKRAFERHGCRVDLAADGEAALEILRGERTAMTTNIDAVLADLKLPVITGLDVIKTMLAERIDATQVLYTAFVDDPEAREAAGLGIAVVSKLGGAGPLELPGVVRDMVERHRAHRLAKVDEVARVLATTATRLGGQGTLSEDWRAKAAAPLARALTDPTIEFAIFLTIAEALRFVLDTANSPRTAATFLSVQAERCRYRSEVCAAARLDQAVARLEREHRGLLWTLAHSHESISVVAGGAGVKAALRAMCCSHGEALQAIALRYAAIRVANTPEQTAQIAYEVGVQHPESFYRFFKNWLGLPPRDLRQLLQDR